MTYSEKLKDPRWQKKRLEILERDNWACQRCFDTNSTLHIHHLYYDFKFDPWEYEDETLITLCEECHQKEKENYKDAIDMLRKGLAIKQFLSSDIRQLASILVDNCKIKMPNDELLLVIGQAVMDEKYIEDVRARAYGKKIN